MAKVDEGGQMARSGVSAVPGAVRGWEWQIVSFLLLAFGLAWLQWVPAAIISQSHPETGQLTSEIPGVYGPFVAALVVTAVFLRGRGVRHLLGRLIAGRVAVGWYLVAIFTPGLLALVAAAIGVLLGFPWPNLAHPAALRMLALPPRASRAGPLVLLVGVFLLELITAPLGEELGWRGFLLPRLQGRMDALNASLVVGVIWSLWHLPLFLTRGAASAQQPYGWVVLLLTAEAVVMTWLFNHTGGSVLLAMLFHAGIDVWQTFYIGLDPRLTWVLALVTALLAVGLALREGVINLRRKGGRVVLAPDGSFTEAPSVAASLSPYAG